MRTALIPKSLGYKIKLNRRDKRSEHVNCVSAEQLLNEIHKTHVSVAAQRMNEVDLFSIFALALRRHEDVEPREREAIACR